MKNKFGFVYCMTNISMPGIVKIGLTENIKDRITNLSTRTAVPTPFKLYRAIEVKDMFEIEKQFHDYFREQRTNSQREFFTISPEETDPLFDHYEKIGAKNFDKTILPEREEKELIDNKVKEFRDEYKKRRKVYAINTNFRIKRYNFNTGWMQLVKKGLDIYPNNANQIVKKNFKKIYLEKGYGVWSKIKQEHEVDHNLISHQEISGIINVTKEHLSLTNNGLEFKRNSSEKNFRTCLKSKILESDTLEFYPYSASMKILDEVKELSNIEFLWGIYVMKDTSDSEIKKCILRIEDIKKINIDYEKFNNLKDLFYVMSVTNDLNFKFKDQIEISQNTDLKKKFEIVDFVGSTLSRLDLEFKYFKNHLILLWPEKYHKNSLENLLTN